MDRFEMLRRQTTGGQPSPSAPMTDANAVPMVLPPPDYFRILELLSKRRRVANPDRSSVIRG